MIKFLIGKIQDYDLLEENLKINEEILYVLTLEDFENLVSEAKANPEKMYVFIVSDKFTFDLLNIYLLVNILDDNEKKAFMDEHKMTFCLNENEIEAYEFNRGFLKKCTVTNYGIFCRYIYDIERDLRDRLNLLKEAVWQKENE